MAQPSTDRRQPDLGRRRAPAPVAAGGDKYGQVKERAFEGAEDAKERVQENGLVQRLVAAHKELTGSGVSVSKVRQVDMFEGVLGSHIFKRILQVQVQALAFNLTYHPVILVHLCKEALDTRHYAHHLRSISGISFFC